MITQDARNGSIGHEVFLGLKQIAGRLEVPMNDLVRHQASLELELTAAVRRIITEGWYVLGREGEAFEREFASYCGAKHAVGVANGTDAIELALRAAGVQAGDVVITAANAGFYTTASILAIEARPGFADVDLVSHAISTSTLAKALDKYPLAKAVVVTHLYGRLADAGTLSRMCASAGIPMIEDCAQAHGARRDGRHSGTFGLAGCFSFYPTKNLGAIGDAGAIVTEDDELAQAVRSLRQYGWKTKYHVELIGGRNSRLDEIQAAILLAKLPWLEAWNSRRKAIAEVYSCNIAHPRVVCPEISGGDYVAHLYVIRCENRDLLRQHLHDRGISTEVHYPVPDYKQVALQHLGPWPSLPITERLSFEVLTLPCFPGMTAAEIDYVTAAVNEW